MDSKYNNWFKFMFTIVYLLLGSDNFFFIIYKVFYNNVTVNFDYSFIRFEPTNILLKLVLIAFYSNILSVKGKRSKYI